MASVASSQEAQPDDSVGILLVSLSTFMASISNLCIKRLGRLSHPLHPLQMIRFRMYPTWILCLSYLQVGLEVVKSIIVPSYLILSSSFFTGQPDPIFGPKDIRLLLLARSLLSFFSMLGTYVALKGLALSEATLIGFLNPVITGLLGSVLLGEKYTSRQAIATLISLIGIVISLGPSTHKPTAGEMTRMSAILLGLGSVTAGALSSIFIRKMGASGNIMRQMNAYAMVSTIGSTIALHMLPNIPRLPEYGPWMPYASAAALCGSAGQVLMTAGMKRGRAGTSALGNYTAIIYATFLEYMADGKVPSTSQVLGCALIVGSAAYVSAR